MTLGELRDDPPYWAAMYTQWDETRQSLWFTVDERRIKQTVDVMVSKLVISWGWPGRPPHFLECILPPIPLPNVDWNSLRHGLENSYFARIFLKYAFAILALATSPFKYRWGARDNASGNLKYCAVSTAVFKDLVSSDFFDCVNHQNMLGHLDTVVTVFGLEYLHGINSVAGFLNLSAHRMRMLVVCYEVLMGIVELEPGGTTRGRQELRNGVQRLSVQVV